MHIHMCVHTHNTVFLHTHTHTTASIEIMEHEKQGSLNVRDFPMSGQLNSGVKVPDSDGHREL